MSCSQPIGSVRARCCFTSQLLQVHCNSYCEFRSPSLQLGIANSHWAFSWGVTPLKNLESHIDASHSRQPLVKGERLVRYEVNAVMQLTGEHLPLVYVSAARCCFGRRRFQLA